MFLTTQRVRVIRFFVTGTGGYYLTYFSNTTQNVIQNKALFIRRPISQSVHHFTLEWMILLVVTRRVAAAPPIRPLATQ